MCVCVLAYVRLFRICLHFIRRTCSALAYVVEIQVKLHRALWKNRVRTTAYGLWTKVTKGLFDGLAYSVINSVIFDQRQYCKILKIYNNHNIHPYKIYTCT